MWDLSRDDVASGSGAWLLVVVVVEDLLWLGRVGVVVERHDGNGRRITSVERAEAKGFERALQEVERSKEEKGEERQGRNSLKGT